MATPSDPKEAPSSPASSPAWRATYGKGKYCPSGTDNCKDLDELSKTLAESRDPASFATPGPAGTPSRAPCAPISQRYVELANEGARNLGYPDLGALWRAKYDMPPDAFAADVDRLWVQVKPLYDSLHCLRPPEAQRDLRQLGRAPRPADPGAPARQHVGAVLGQPLPHGGARRRRPRLRPDRAAARDRYRHARHGPLRRALLLLARLRAPARHLLAALACSPSRATATWCATRRRGTSTGPTTSA